MFPSIRRTLQEAGNLTLARLESVDAGLYECVATNSVATVVTSTLLIIERTYYVFLYDFTADKQVKTRTKQYHRPVNVA